MLGGGSAVVASLAARLRAWRRLPLSLAANRARDRGACADAAELYARALRLDPARTDLRVQRANMLKDAGCFDLAEAEYLTALAQRPGDGDIHLQLGHLHKTLGHRDQATAHYRCAQALSPTATAPVEELALLGDPDAQDARFRAVLASHGLESLLDNAADVEATTASLGKLSAILPEVIARSAFPLTRYGLLRRVWDIPAPPDGEWRPLSVLIAMEGLPPGAFDRMARGALDQAGGEFELLLSASSPSSRTDAARLASDRRVRVIEDGENLAELVRRARYDLVVLPAPGARLHPQALAWFGRALADESAAAFVCDEERQLAEDPIAVVGGPVLRQVVDHEVLLQANPFGATLALDRGRCATYLDELGSSTSGQLALALLLELACDRRVGHIPYPLASTNAAAASDAEAYLDVVQAHMARRGLAASAECALAADDVAKTVKVRWRARDAAARLNLVVPTRDNGEDVRAFVASLRATCERPGQMHITVVDNGSVEAATLRILTELAGPDLVVRRCDEPFNWSRLSNLGASADPAELVVFANDDMVMLTNGWDTLLRGLLERPDVGVIGAKLLYPDQTIQHAGIRFGWGGRAIHDGLFEPRHAAGPDGRWQLRRRVSAVTGAFLAMRKPVFDELGGFDEQRLAVGYSDLDIALKARLGGLAVLYAPEIELTHYESKSRGLTHLDPVAAARDEAELATLRARWPGALDADVAVNPLWHDATLPFRLLAPPSRSAVMRHIAATASEDPWRPDVAHPA